MRDARDGNKNAEKKEKELNDLTIQFNVVNDKFNELLNALRDQINDFRKTYHTGRQAWQPDSVQQIEINVGAKIFCPHYSVIERN
ncbi:MAG: hypothetical protein LBJ67_02865 [Planctomycetaceae bacterium]|nr:hypothetical protein [Planctomycetaceae bacterium]